MKNGDIVRSILTYKVGKVVAETEFVGYIENLEGDDEGGRWRTPSCTFADIKKYWKVIEVFNDNKPETDDGTIRRKYFYKNYRS